MPPDLAAQWDAYRAAPQAEARQRLIEAYLPLARSIAAGLYAQRGPMPVEFRDYLQLATIGLIEAVDRFDPARGVPFEGYASLRVRGAVLNALASMSETYQQHALRRRLEDDRALSLREGAAPAGDLFSELAGIAVGFALGYLLEGSGLVASSVDEPRYRQDFYGETEQRERERLLARLVDALPEQERRVVRYHYYQGLPFTEIADLMGVSKGRISQIHRQALQLIREAGAAEGDLSLLG